MNPKVLLIVLIGAPVLGSCLLPLLGRYSPKARNLIAFLAVSVSFLCALALLPAVIKGGLILVSLNFGFGHDLFVADQLAVFMALVSSLVGAVIVFYSFDYISHYPNQGEYYFMVVLFLGSMMGLVFAANLIVLYVFWELTAFASWRLIGFFREPAHVLRADKAFLMTFFGALLMLIGFIAVQQQAGSFDLAAVKHAFQGRVAPDYIVLLILAGLFAKSATLPLQTWLPDAGIAPSPVTALLHAAVLVKIGVYVYARLLIATLPVADIWHVIVPALAGLSALVAAGAALLETDLKRIIAYSTISQIGFIFLGFAVNNQLAAAGALLYILMHGLAKGGLFLCAGIIEQKTHTKDITKMGGLIASMPVTAVSFLVCAFSVMGLPPLGGFFSKYGVIAGAVSGGQLWLALLFVATAILTIVYLMRVFVIVFMGAAPAGAAVEGSPRMVFSVALLAFLSVIGGIFIMPSFGFAASAVQQVMGLIGSFP
ncbi:MAG: proton-conducting transporter membrane subunit [Kiritimatiellae bacterium]|nr:proton-conducting transporter membrane subunit [Kiritimatiellia bacterium]